jgi:hypothetical protein
LSLSEAAAIEGKYNHPVTFCAIQRSLETGELTEMQLFQTYRSNVPVGDTVQITQIINELNKKRKVRGLCPFFESMTH